MIFLAALATPSFAESPVTWIRSMFTGESPVPLAVTETEAWQRAAALAAENPGAIVLLGSGHSMEPLYEPGTVLVIVRRAFTELKRGQTVLYRNKENRMVAHLLLAHVRDGWRVRGLNNRWHDMEPVVAENLAGVVLAAFAPTGPAGRQVAARASAPTESAWFYADPVTR